MTNPIPDDSAIGLLDDYAFNAMVALMQIYAPEKFPDDHEDLDKWCDAIASRSYYMATAMLEARQTLHGVIMQVATEKEEQREND